MDQHVKFKGKLRKKIFLVIMLVSVVPIVVSGAITAYLLTESHKFDVAGLEDALLLQKSSEIGNFLNDKALGLLDIHLANFDSRESDFDAAASNQESLLRQIVRSANGADSAIAEASFISLKTGEETARVGLNLSGELANLELRNQSELAKFKSAAAGGVYLGQVYFTLSGPMLTAAEPVKDKNGLTVAVISGEISLNGLREIVENAKIGESGYVYLVDGSGFPVWGGGPFVEADAREAKLLEENGLAADLLDAKKDLVGADNQRRYENHPGEKVVAAGTYLDKFGWALVAEWPAKEADAVLLSLIYRDIATSFLVFLVVLGASIFLSSLITGPIKSLEGGTERVAEGKFEESVEIKTGDELEELGLAFNEMTKGLKRLQELKDEFVFIAAHELRTPVAAMKGYADLVLGGASGAVNEKTRDFVEKIKKANERLIQLVSDLLEVARSEAGRLTIKVSPVDAAGPIAESLQELKPLADEKGIKLIYNSQKDLPKVMADTDRLKEVIVNLVGNSIKYMGSPGAGSGEAGGSGTVTVSHELHAGMLVTDIKDTGIGIPEEARKRLFEKFYRVPSEKTQGITGTGLGLFIVKEMIEKMGGKIWFVSAEGKGSTFSFGLPVA